MDRLKINVLASGSSGNAYTVYDGKTTLLIDCGIPLSEIQHKTNFFNPMIKACLISHSHGDHAKSLKDLMRLGVQCYMSNETAVETLGDLADLTNRITIVEHLKEVTIGTFVLHPLKMSHDVHCIGFSIFSAQTGESLFFATDTCYIPYIFKHSFDYIMVEANYDIDILNKRIMDGYIDPSMKNRLARSHMEISNTIKWLEAQNLSKTKRIYLLHLSHGSSHAAEFKRRVIEATGIPVQIA